MKQVEIKEIREYCWGSLVRVHQKDCEEILLTVNAKHLGATFVITGLVLFILGVFVGKW